MFGTAMNLTTPLEIPPQEPARTASGAAWDAARGMYAAIERSVPEEVAVAIMAGKKPAAVVIASPADYADLGWGFALTEGLAAKPGDIAGCSVTPEAAGVRVVVELVAQGRRGARAGAAGAL